MDIGLKILKKKYGVRQAVFFHSLFRSGSTYLFNKFRKNEQFWCYYEPFHHELIRLTRDDLSLFRYDAEATAQMNHPDLDAPHFNEYSLVFNGRRSLPYFHQQFCYKDFVEVSKPISTYRYLANLINRAPANRLPVLQFNRSSGRVDWLKLNFPKAIHFFLLRDPAHQFESYYQRLQDGNPYFLAMNIYILYLNPKYQYFKGLLAKLPRVRLSRRNISNDLATCIQVVEGIPIELHYEIFYHIWLVSLVKSCTSADCIVTMDDPDAGYNIRRYLQEYSNLISWDTLDFSDYSMQKYNRVSMPLEQRVEIEEATQNIYGKTIGEKVQKYLRVRSEII